MLCADHRVGNIQLICWFLTHKSLEIPSVSIFVNILYKTDGFIEHVQWNLVIILPAVILPQTIGFWSPKEKNCLFTRKPLCIANFSIWENPRITVVSLTGEMWI